MGRKSLVWMLCFLVSIAHNEAGFVYTRGDKFMKDGRSYYFNGFNAYWLMTTAADPSQRYKVSDAFYQASKYGLNLARTWAFNDGNASYRALQISPGKYNEDVFKGLDFAVAEAKKCGIYLILSLVNNYNDFGGKKQYVQWARDEGHNLKTDDDFFTDPLVKGFYKNHIKVVLTRVNSLTGVAYKDDPTIVAWELINEPRTPSDISGRAFQGWVAEIATYIKSMDQNHLVEIGLEGFYGQSTPDKTRSNPLGYQVGTDFIANNRNYGIDFATIHLYPDIWLAQSNATVQAQFVEQWIQSHVFDSKSILHKPILIAEFGKSSRGSNNSVQARDKYFLGIYNDVFSSATRGGPCGGALFWQVMVPGMEGSGDGYEVVLENSASTAYVIQLQSKRMSNLIGH